MAPRTASEAAQLLAQSGKHAHLHSDHETICVSDACTPVPSVLSGLIPSPAPHQRYL
ncbi:hypothetical protein [Streptomyces griseosporeus]|uniref:hypothetical protein n=1 Tax=Streptomyces griseosporeus TaxID=1910 RepID=UPI0036FFC819